MKIDGIIWNRDIEAKLAAKHGVLAHEAEEVFDDKPKFRFMAKGDRTGEDVFTMLGQSDSGRYLAVLFIYKKTREAYIITVRDMTRKERKLYGKK